MIPFLKRRNNELVLLTTKIATDDIWNNTFRPNTLRSGGSSSFPTPWALPIVTTLTSWSWKHFKKTKIRYIIKYISWPDWANISLKTVKKLYPWIAAKMTNEAYHPLLNTPKNYNYYFSFRKLHLHPQRSICSNDSSLFALNGFYWSWILSSLKLISLF